LRTAVDEAYAEFKGDTKRKNADSFLISLRCSWGNDLWAMAIQASVPPSLSLSYCTLEKARPFLTA